MTITFNDDEDIIVYALEKVISYARQHQIIFRVQCVWWISANLGLQEELVIHIDNLNGRENIIDRELRVEPLVHSEGSKIHPGRVASVQNSVSNYTSSKLESISTTETDIHNEVIDNCELLLDQSKQERKAIGHFTRQANRVIKRKANKKKPIKTFGTQTEGIDGKELRRRRPLESVCGVPGRQIGKEAIGLWIASSGND
jgi:hypothetical protein